jgi:hypothetical protein
MKRILDLVALTRIKAGKAATANIPLTDVCRGGIDLTDVEAFR